jgi:hypothetical protein
LQPAFAGDEIAEVEIEAQREQLHVMQAEIIKLEDQFFAEYNKLNTDHPYDSFCTFEAAKCSCGIDFAASDCDLR